MWSAWCCAPARLVSCDGCCEPVRRPLCANRAPGMRLSATVRLDALRAIDYFNAMKRSTVQSGFTTRAVCAMTPPLQVRPRRTHARLSACAEASRSQCPLKSEGMMQHCARLALVQSAIRFGFVDRWLFCFSAVRRLRVNQQPQSAVPRCYAVPRSTAAEGRRASCDRRNQCVRIGRVWLRGFGVSAASAAR